MTRLINADALKFKNVADVNGILTHILTAEDIDNAPTVELDESVIQEVLNKRCMSVVANEYLIKLHNERPHGEWIRKGDSKWHCSECGAVPEFGGTTNTDKFNVTMSNKYCRLCGADMRGRCGR